MDGKVLQTQKSSFAPSRFEISKFGSDIKSSQNKYTRTNFAVDGFNSVKKRSKWQPKSLFLHSLQKETDIPRNERFAKK